MLCKDQPALFPYSAWYLTFYPLSAISTIPDLKSLEYDRDRSSMNPELISGPLFGWFSFSNSSHPYTPWSSGQISQSYHKPIHHNARFCHTYHRFALHAFFIGWFKIIAHLLNIVNYFFFFQSRLYHIALPITTTFYKFPYESLSFADQPLQLVIGFDLFP